MSTRRHSPDLMDAVHASELEHPDPADVDQWRPMCGVVPDAVRIPDHLKGKWAPIVTTNQGDITCTECRALIYGPGTAIDQPTTTGSMLDLCDVTLGPLRAAVLGHRAELIAAGVIPEIADSMALDAHEYITHILSSADDESKEP